MTKLPDVNGDLYPQILLVTNRGLSCANGTRLFINGVELGLVEDATLAVKVGERDTITHTELWVKLGGAQAEIICHEYPETYVPPVPERRNKADTLLRQVELYIEENHITTPEAFYHDDSLNLGFPEAMEKIVEIVGYAKEEEHGTK